MWYVFSFIDRQILSLLVGSIHRDVGIGETQMSLLMGASFAVFYTLFGIPLGRLTDTWSRRGPAWSAGGAVALDHSRTRPSRHTKKNGAKRLACDILG